MSFALKFISGKYQGGEFPLKSNKQIVIGRSSELDMVLVEDMVSRKHAKITVGQDGKIAIEDLGSTNGTFVNGEKVKQSRLKEGDRILIGTSILKLVQQGGAAEVDDRVVRQKLEEAAAVQARRGSSMTGKIEEIPLPDLLQLFHTSKKNGVLIVRQPQQEARIYLRTGRVYYAVINDNHELGPQKSFNRIIQWEQGDFELSAEEPPEFMVELETSTEGLLMDGLRSFDEFRRLQKFLPPATASLLLSAPMNAPLRELTPEQLDVLQLVHNFGVLGGVLDHSDKDDVATAELLVELLKRDYVRAS